MAVTPLVTSGFTGLIQPQIATDIFADAARQSAIMRLAQQTPLGGSGQAIPIVTGKPAAGWVAEGGVKPLTSASLGVVNMVPKKLAAIVPMSMELYRANPAGFEAKLSELLAGAFAEAFDAAAFHGTNTPFDAYLAETANTQQLGTAASYYLDLVAALGDLDGKLNGWAFDTAAEATLLAGVDANERPLISPSAAETIYGTLLNRPVTLAEGVGSATIAGFGGDWSKAAWGVVGGIEYKISEEASVADASGNMVSAFQNNLVLVRAEAEYGFVIEDPDKFVAVEYPAVVS